MTAALAALADLPIWVAWQAEQPPGRKPTKVPYSPTGTRARSDDPTTWCRRMEAEATARRLPKPLGMGGIGIQFTGDGNGHHYAGADLDTCRDPATGAVEPWAAEVVARFATYTEISPSGTGLKCFFIYRVTDLPAFHAAMGNAQHGKEFKRGAGEHPPSIELYLSNRYFTVTEQRFDGMPLDLRILPAADIMWLLREAGPAFVSQSGERRAVSTAKESTRGGIDQSRSAAAFRLGVSLRRTGKTYDEMVWALRADPETAAWYTEKGEANDQRELKRIWDKAGDAIPPATMPDGRPVIPVIAGQAHILADRAEAALLGAGAHVFHRAGQLVRPGYSEVSAADGRTVMAASLNALETAAVSEELSAVAGWMSWNARQQKWLATDPPPLVVAVLAARKGKWKLKAVDGIMTCPTLRPDGSVLSAPGYDAETRLFMMPDPALRLLGIPDYPSRGDAEAALGVLKNLLVEFPFVTPADQAVALSLMISCVVRGALGPVPVHAFTAPAPGTGKSYLADIATAVVSGRWCPVITPGKTEEELEKRLGAMLLAGYPTISLDNCSAALKGDALCQVAERPTVRVRILGKSKTSECEFRGVIIANGNNLAVEGDMTRRVLLGSLDANAERPEERTFRFDPVRTVLANRGLYVAAALVLVKAYIAAGLPGRLPPLASYERWSDLVRSPLVCLGEADPVKTMEAVRASSPELNTLRTILEAWRDAFGENAHTAREAVAPEPPFSSATPPDPKACEDRANLRAALAPIAATGGILDPERLGLWLRKSKNRPAGGLKFITDGVMHGGGAAWKVVRQ